MKNILLLGATGSVGTQTLDVLEKNPKLFKLVTIAIGKNIKKGIEIINQFKPKYISCELESDALSIKKLFPDIEVGFGMTGLINAATYDANNGYKTTVVTALVGSVGLVPTVEAIKKGYDIALANKETLVTAGKLIMDLVKKMGVKLLPVDSEHSAIFQCLNGEKVTQVKQIIITASGGAFRDKSRNELEHVTLQDALKHPNWSMGSKITIDSATMMNKGFEVIEAHFLFSLPYNQITTLIHKESVIHSLVEFNDTSIMAQLGTPDMRIPIQYALTYPKRVVTNTKRLSLADISTLHFKAMDFERFPCLKYAYDAGLKGHSAPTVLNAANEAAVSLFLQEKIRFLDIERIIYNELEQHDLILNPDLTTIISLDTEIKNKVYRSFNLKGDQ